MKNSGFSLLEVLVAIAVMAIVAGIAVPFAHNSVERSRAAAAANYIAARLALARFEAVKRTAFVAIRFIPGSGGYFLQAYVDGNANGVLTSDIAMGIDSAISGEERIDYHFPGISFGIHPHVTALDPGQSLDPNDPIHIGSSTLLSFNPNGSSTSGTLFIRGHGFSQFAVRILGATGRTRVFEFDFGRGAWRSH